MTRKNEVLALHAVRKRDRVYGTKFVLICYTFGQQPSESCL